MINNKTYTLGNKNLQVLMTRVAYYLHGFKTLLVIIGRACSNLSSSVSIESSGVGFLANLQSEGMKAGFDKFVDHKTDFSALNSSLLNNPISLIDPDGNEPLPPNEYDQNGNQISNLGGNQIDFFHQKDGGTKIVDRKTGASNLIQGGERLIRGYEQRPKDISPLRLTAEWDLGFGPENSMISDFTNSNIGVFGSLRSTFSLFSREIAFKKLRLNY